MQMQMTNVLEFKNARCHTAAGFHFTLRRRFRDYVYHLATCHLQLFTPCNLFFTCNFLLLFLLLQQQQILIATFY